jgi:hypothetical protein
MSSNTNIGKAVTMYQLLEFELIFPNEPRRSIKDYLINFERPFALKAAACFLGFKNQNSEFSNIRDFVAMYFSEPNREIAFNILSIVNQPKYKDTDFTVINPYSSLRLFKFLFSVENDPEPKKPQTNADFEINLSYNLQSICCRENIQRFILLTKRY